MTVEHRYHCSKRRRVDFEAFDESYLQRLTSGDDTTEQHFVSYFGRLIRMKLRSRVRSQELIDDICQETFLRVLSKLRNKGGVEYPERFGAFVNTVCEYVMLERFRAQTQTDPFPYDDFDTPDPNANTESELVSNERRRIVEQVLRGMPANHRELLRMIFWEEKDKAEVCRHFNVDRDYLRVLVHRAKFSFRSLMREAQYSIS
jgi:RNA polymerase sigma-70 factor, ECF subfamily